MISRLTIAKHLPLCHLHICDHSPLSSLASRYHHLHPVTVTCIPLPSLASHLHTKRNYKVDLKINWSRSEIVITQLTIHKFNFGELGAVPQQYSFGNKILYQPTMHTTHCNVLSLWHEPSSFWPLTFLSAGNPLPIKCYDKLVHELFHYCVLNTNCESPKIWRLKVSWFVGWSAC